MNAPPAREAIVAPVDLTRAEDFGLGSARVHPSAREIEIGGKIERLQPRVMQVLTALARARGAVVSRDDLIEACWEGLAVGEDAINRVIGKLRRLAELAPDAFAIETVSKVGYRLIADPPTRHHDPNGEGASADLAEVGAAAPGGAARGRPAPMSAALRSWRARIGPRGLIAVGVAILVAALALGTTLLSGPGRGSDQNGLVEVMLFAPLEPEDPDLARLSTALSHAIVRLLSGSGTKVMPQPACADAGSSGTKAEFRVAGTLLRTRDSFVIDAQILERRSGLVLWSGQFERSIEHATGFENEAAHAIAGYFYCALYQRKTARRRMTAEVFSLFLNACDAGIGKEPERLLNVSQRLIAAAPDLAVAHAMHARALAVASDLTDAPDEAALMTEQSRASAHYALRLDRRTPQAYVALALTYEGGWSEIERNLRRAIEIDPEFPFTRNVYASFLYDVGRTNAGIVQLNRVSRVADPRPRWHLIQLALTHASLGDRREAEAAMERLRSIEPQLASGVEWEIAMWWQDVAVARSRLRALGQELGVSERDIRCMDLYLSRLERQPSGARGLPSECTHMQWDWRVRMLARQGDVDGAYALYAEAAPPRARYRTRGFFYPEMRAFRRDARFMQLAERLGLVDYWIATDKWPDFCSEPDLPHDCRAAARAAQAHVFPPVVSTASTTNRAAAPRARSATSASRRSSPRRSKRHLRM